MSLLAVPPTSWALYSTVHALSPRRATARPRQRAAERQSRSVVAELTTWAVVRPATLGRSDGPICTAKMWNAITITAVEFLLAHVAVAEIVESPSVVHPASFYWQMAGAATSTASSGFSFYTRIFSLFDEANPLDMQMGMGGTWLTPTNISWAGLPAGVCACNPKGWPSSTPGDPAEHCCEKETRCSFLYETFEGGPGYWIGQLPTRTPKWRVNSAVGCYKDQTSTPLFNFGQAGAPHSCDAMGIAQLSNTMLMAPDGLTFEQGKEGMVGVSYVRTPIGKVKDADDRNFWTILVDTGKSPTSV